MEKVHINGLMEDSITETTRMTRNLDLVCMFGLMAELMLATGMMANKQMREYIFYQMEMSEKANGRMELDKTGLI